MTKSEVTQAIAKRLRAARQGRDMSQPEFARLIGMSKQCISAWETEKAQLSALQIIQCANILGVDSSWLLTGDQQRGWTPVGGQPNIPVLTQEQVAGLATGKFELGLAKLDALNHFKLSSRCFAFTIADRSMSPILEEGDVGIVDPGRRTSQGDIVLAAVENVDDELKTAAIVRQLIFLVRGSAAPMILAPISPDWPLTRTAGSGEHCVLGPVVASIRELPRPATGP